MKRTLTLLLVLLITMGAQAVLKEKDLEQTLHILRTELTTHHRELSQQIEMNRKQSELVRQQLMETMQRSDQNSLMLYSQKLDYVFDLTYACHLPSPLIQVGCDEGCSLVKTLFSTYLSSMILPPYSATTLMVEENKTIWILEKSKYLRQYENPWSVQFMQLFIETSMFSVFYLNYFHWK